MRENTVWGGCLRGSLKHGFHPAERPEHPCPGLFFSLRRFSGLRPHAVFPLFQPVAPVPDPSVTTGPTWTFSCNPPASQSLLRISQNSRHFLWRQSFHHTRQKSLLAPVRRVALWCAPLLSHRSTMQADTLHRAFLPMWGRGVMRPHHSGGGVPAPPPPAYPTFSSGSGCPAPVPGMFRPASPRRFPESASPAR